MEQQIQQAISEIKVQSKEFPQDEFEELTLDSIHFQKFTNQLKEEIEKFQNICSLTLNDCKLKSLENFPVLPKLIKLEMIDNYLSASHLSQLPQFPELQSLSLGGNKIQKIEEIKILQKYTELAELDFLGCEITNEPNYREKLFEMFPSLLILDNMDKDGKEVELDDDDEDDDDDEEGKELGDDDEDDEEELEEDDEQEEDEEEDEEEEDEEEEPALEKKQKK